MNNPIKILHNHPEIRHWWGWGWSQWGIKTKIYPIGDKLLYEHIKNGVRVSKSWSYTLKPIQDSHNHWVSKERVKGPLTFLFPVFNFFKVSRKTLKRWGIYE